MEKPYPSLDDTTKADIFDLPKEIERVFLNPRKKVRPKLSLDGLLDAYPDFQPFISTLRL